MGDLEARNVLMIALFLKINLTWKFLLPLKYNKSSY